jgi:hypothetical protein
METEMDRQEFTKEATSMLGITQENQEAKTDLTTLATFDSLLVTLFSPTLTAHQWDNQTDLVAYLTKRIALLQKIRDRVDLFAKHYECLKAKQEEHNETY